MVNNCLFCNLKQDSIIAENLHAVATYNQNAIKTGHVVISTKEHIISFSDLSVDAAKSVMCLALKVSKVIENFMKLDKIYLLSAGDKEQHFHIHLLPKNETDEPIGQYVLTEKGWKGVVTNTVTELDVQDFIKKMKIHLKNEQ